jgi:hypothetical protein
MLLYLNPEKIKASCLDPVLSGFSLEHDSFLVVAPVPEPWRWALLLASLYLGGLTPDFPSF